MIHNVGWYEKAKTVKTVAHSSENKKFKTTQELFKIVAHSLEYKNINTIQEQFKP